MKLRLLSLGLVMSLMMSLMEAQEGGADEDDVAETITKANSAVASRLFEGDIVKDRRRNAVSCRFCKWFKFRDWVYVPIYISSSYNSVEKAVIRSALQSIQDQTCIWFYEISRRATYYQHHLYLYSGSGCWSYIGRQIWMRRQKVSLSKNGCIWRSIVQHELLHALGFAHEHSRSDRDDYIRVLTQNIQPGLEGNFAKYKTNNLRTPYDFNSVMQYSNFAFSKNGRPTLESRSDPDLRFGRASEVSANDLLRINRYYNCKDRAAKAPRGPAKAPRGPARAPRSPAQDQA